MQIFDPNHQLVRHFSSTNAPPHARPPSMIAERWFPKPQMVETTPRMHRFIWNLTWAGSGVPASDDDDDRVPLGPRVTAGMYEVHLTVDGKAYTAPLKVVMDPRSGATPAVLTVQMQTAREIFMDSLRSRK